MKCPQLRTGLTGAVVAAAALLSSTALAQNGDLNPRIRAALSEIERELDSGRYARAQRRVRQALDDILVSGPVDTEPTGLGRLLFYDALAAAGRDLPESSAWSWSIARSIDPELSDERLGRWRQAGDRLRSLPLRQPAADSDILGGDGEVRGNLFSESADVSLPRAQNRPEPRFPPSLRGRGAGGTVILQIVVDRRGRPRDPLVIESSHPLLSFAAADAVRGWRFEPATVGRDRVDVVYDLRFDLQPQ